MLTFISHVDNECFVPSTVLAVGGTVVTIQNPCLCGTYILVTGGNNQ